jgi:predicted XRE-type DNA-binding protein
VHQLVALAFLPNPLNLLTVNHDDGDTSNNKVGNLEWASHQDQQDHAWSTGLSAHCGEAGTNVKLTTAQVLQIPAHLAAGKSQRVVADMYGVNQSQISRIAGGQRWQRALAKEQHV